MRSRVLLGFTAVLLASLLSCCFLPNLLVRVCYGNWPIGDPNQYKYDKGMTGEEVRAMLGPPHERYADEEGETWYYYCDAFGFAIVGMKFDREGLMVSDWW